MFFRNLQVYQLTAPFTHSSERLEELLSERFFQPCSGLTTHRLGWFPPLGAASEQLIHVTNGRMMLCMKRQERLLPSSVIRESVEEKVEAIAHKEGRTLSRNEKSRIKEEVIVDLLPRAFTRSTLTYLFIDPESGWLIVDSSSATKAEEVLMLLRDTVGSLKIRPLTVKGDPAALLTRWLNGETPAEVVMANECELVESGEKKGVVRMRGVDLEGDEVVQHLQSGKLVSKLALVWQERISCVVGSDLSFRRFKLTDTVMEESADVAAEDAALRFDADFALMALELSRFLPHFCDYFGGLAETE
ncbi:MAG: recombination-associated protein RdgC [Gammaproteobacteria bacterium]|nr:recombination-associated protein RdgC [Gammaproteobacteria bacterium]